MVSKAEAKAIIFSEITLCKNTVLKIKTYEIYAHIYFNAFAGFVQQCLQQRRWQRRSGPWHGSGGPLHITDIAGLAHPCTLAFLKAGSEAGLPISRDLNGATIDFGGNKMDLEDLKLTVEDLERFGPTLILDQKNEGGDRVLVWSQ